MHGGPRGRQGDACRGKWPGPRATANASGGGVAEPEFRGGGQCREDLGRERARLGLEQCP